jgi:hypothetical protein
VFKGREEANDLLFEENNLSLGASSNRNVEFEQSSEGLGIIYVGKRRSRCCRVGGRNFSIAPMVERRSGSRIKFLFP